MSRASSRNRTPARIRKHGNAGDTARQTHWAAFRLAVIAASFAALLLTATAGPASAISANIHIHGTAPENVVNIRPQPNTSQPPLGAIPEGASPDYNCFAYGEVIGGVRIWFSVNYDGVTGFYASYYDDSSYHSDAELTSKYGIRKCGDAAPAPAPTPTPAPPAPTPTPAPPAPTPSEATQGLPPDPNIWCYGTAIHRWDTQVREADWTVQYDGLRGTPHQNNWRCRFLVVMEIPTGADSFTLPPVPEYVGVDFAEACRQQFPGSTLHYMLGPIYTTPWPWECLGKAGAYYPPPSLSLSDLTRAGGYSAHEIHARTAGSISLRLTTATSTAHSATAARRQELTLARGSRNVRRAGSYAVRVRLTHRGRALLRRLKYLRITFTLRIHPRGGLTETTSTTVTLRR